MPKQERQPIETAPKDGRVIIVGDDDVGTFVMSWNPTGNNTIFAPDAIGIWEAVDKSMTWNDADGFGPSYWMPLQPEIEANNDDQ